VNCLLDVPTAFTPGTPGTNSVINVVGFGISEMDWNIYNRQGELVFHSTDPSNGWDGTYKGTLQPTDVYTYTLEAGFTNGTKLKRTGDITLLR
jgi:gliding motility-associated-like protein